VGFTVGGFPHRGVCVPPGVGVNRLDEPSGCDLRTKPVAASFGLAGSGREPPLYWWPMHGETSPGMTVGAPPTARTRARRRLRLLAVLLNAGLLGAGLYFQAHPRDRHDLWSASGVAAVAVVNSAALTVPTRGRAGAGFVLRLRRIALFANTLLLATACVIVGLSALRDWRHAALHGVALAVPPLLTIVALRRYPQG
jgi:hypothetical protein